MQRQCALSRWMVFLSDCKKCAVVRYVSVVFALRLSWRFEDMVMGGVLLSLRFATTSAYPP